MKKENEEHNVSGLNVNNVINFYWYFPETNIYKLFPHNVS